MADFHKYHSLIAGGKSTRDLGKSANFNTTDFTSLAERLCDIGSHLEDNAKSDIQSPKLRSRTQLSHRLTIICGHRVQVAPTIPTASTEQDSASTTAATRSGVAMVPIWGTSGRGSTSIFSTSSSAGTTAVTTATDTAETDPETTTESSTAEPSTTESPENEPTDTEPSTSTAGDGLEVIPVPEPTTDQGTPPKFLTHAVASETAPSTTTSLSDTPTVPTSVGVEVIPVPEPTSGSSISLDTSTASEEAAPTGTGPRGVNTERVLQGTCSQDGDFNCFDDEKDRHMYQRCIMNVWSDPQLVPDGMLCDSSEGIVSVVSSGTVTGAPGGTTHGATITGGASYGMATQSSGISETAESVTTQVGSPTNTEDTSLIPNNSFVSLASSRFISSSPTTTDLS
ncbi:hypothetical protein QBC47DRAFT_398701 [Echria macrotheca]|uniref:Uncharacterized protein n=1 Tax=Echria macrotheca TaxID=438768 RepID=A0AAJ0FFH9_9PEZI|nr:hypothetical protein QBC47DRAFT_398701 [Echria macrotheca]